MDNIIVSVIIPTYKRSEDIARAVDSVLAQTLDACEVIVVDDNGVGTEDGEKTAAVMSQYENNSKVCYIQHEVNKNGSAARNTGIRKAKGQFISFLDDDDAYFPRRLEKMVSRMEELDKAWGACYTGYVKRRDNGNDQYSAEKNEGDLFCQALMRSLYIGSGSNLFFRKEVVDDIGFFDESFRRNQDLEYLIRVLSKYKMAYVDDILLETFQDIRTTHLTIEEHWEKEKNFRRIFSEYLKRLDKKQQRSVQAMYDIDWIRLCIALKEYKRALQTVIKSRIPIYVYIDYLRYINNRMKTNTSYGFVVKIR